MVVAAVAVAEDDGGRGEEEGMAMVKRVISVAPSPSCSVSYGWFHILVVNGAVAAGANSKIGGGGCGGGAEGEMSTKRRSE